MVKISIQEANDKILEVANAYKIPTVQYNDDDLVTGKECRAITFRCLPQYNYNVSLEEDNKMVIKANLSCWIREMSEYTLEEMQEILKQCQQVISVVSELEEFFSDKLILTKN